MVKGEIKSWVNLLPAKSVASYAGKRTEEDTETRMVRIELERMERGTDDSRQ